MEVQDASEEQAAAAVHVGAAPADRPPVGARGEAAIREADLVPTPAAAQPEVIELRCPAGNQPGMFARLTVAAGEIGSVEFSCTGCRRQRVRDGWPCTAALHEFDLQGHHTGTAYV
jgi:hypothetical protein